MFRDVAVLHSFKNIFILIQTFSFQGVLLLMFYVMMFYLQSNSECSVRGICSGSSVLRHGKVTGTRGDGSKP